MVRGFQVTHVLRDAQKAHKSHFYDPAIQVRLKKKNGSVAAQKMRQK